MKLTAPITNQTANSIFSPSFKRVTGIKFLEEFNPGTSLEDKLTLEAYKNSKAFEYLAENKDVYVAFQKTYYESEKKYNSALHLSISPLNTKNQPLWKKMFNTLKTNFFEDLSVKKYWLSDLINYDTGEITPLAEVIDNISIEQVEKYYF